jgi:hypothetical protein
VLERIKHGEKSAHEMDGGTARKPFLLASLDHALRALLLFELNWLELSTPLGTIGWARGKSPLRLHFFGHRAEPIEVLTRKTQQHRSHLVLLPR